MLFLVSSAPEFFAGLACGMLLIGGISHTKGILSEKRHGGFVSTRHVALLFVDARSPLLGRLWLCYKGKRLLVQENIVVGSIMTVLLCIYGSFSFLFP